MCIKLLALFLDQFLGSSSWFQKGWWPLLYTFQN